MISQISCLRIKFFNMRNSLRFLILTGATLCSLHARAQEGVQTSIHHHYQATRPMGMGDAFVATANDYSALFYNPAGLARRNQGQLNLSVELGGGIETQNFYKDMSEVEKGEYANDGEKQQAYAEFLNKYYGKPL